jgi:hypothetical protein
MEIVMGNRPIAILAYGYDLDSIAGHFTWHYDDDDVQTGGPAWYDQNVDNDFASAATTALLTAHGITRTDFESLSYTERLAAVETLGVQVVRYGGTNGDEQLVLAAKAQVTDWDDGAIPVVQDDLPADAEDKLTWALSVLGITPASSEPRWLLAAHFQ